MICRACGREIREDAVFCPHCGAVRGAEGSAPPVPANLEVPVSSGGKKKGILLAAAVVLVGVVIALAVVVGTLFSNPKSQLEKALGKTIAAYQEASDAMGMPDLYALSERRSVSQRMALTLNSVNSLMLGFDGSSLSGLGLRMSSDLDGQARQLALELGAFWGTDDLLSVRVTADDDEMYFASPQLTGGTAYGVNTETLGADMAALGASGSEEVSFNFFDLVDLAAPEGRNQAMEQALAEASRALWEAAEVKKGDSKTLDINGTDTKASGYEVTLSQAALSDYAGVLEELLSAVNYVELYQEMMAATGVPQEQIDAMLSSLDGLDPYGPLFEAVQDSLELLGDVELTVYVSSGRVCAVFYEDTIQGSPVQVSLALGGGEHYVDDLSLELELDGVKTTAVSSGDHGGVSGAFTDKTTLRIGLAKVNSDFSWEPRSGNLQWELGLDSAGTLEMAGTLLRTGTDAVELSLDNISVRVLGMEVCSIGLDYAIGPCQGVALPEDTPKLIGELDGLELMALMVDVQFRAQSWLNDLETLCAQRLPAELYQTMF